MDERIQKYFNEQLSQTERLSFLLEVEKNNELKKQFAEYQNIYALLNLGRQIENRVTGEQKFQQFVHQKQAGILWKQWLYRIGYAATVLVLVAFSSLLTFWFVKSKQTESSVEIQMNTLYTPAGQRARLVLQDGTEVWLNAKSKLIYPAQFNEKKREVTLEGEAFFDVARNVEKPFIVSTLGVDIKVLGTQFNVHSYPEQDYVQTSLLEGSIAVYLSNQEKEGVILKPNQQVTVSHGKMLVEPIRLNEHFLWRNGIYAFDNEPLIDILKKMEIYYDVKIIVKNSSRFRETYTGKFRQRDSLDDVFRVLQQIRDFRVEKNIDKNEVTLW